LMRTAIDNAQGAKRFINGNSVYRALAQLATTE